MTRIHHECLFIGHLTQIFHHQSVLCPVLEDSAITAVGDQLMRMLCHGLVQVVLDHHHDCGSLFRTMGILIDRTGIHLITGTEAIHIDTSVLFQLLGKLWRQCGMELLGEVTQGIAQCQFFLLSGEDIFSLRCMVDGGIVSLRLGQHIRNTHADIFYEFFVCHNDMWY